VLGWLTIKSINGEQIKYMGTNTTGALSVAERFGVNKLKFLKDTHQDDWPLQVGEKIYWGLIYTITFVDEVNQRVECSIPNQKDAGFFAKSAVTEEMRMDLNSMMKMSSSDQSALDDLIDNEKSAFGSLENGKVKPPPVVVVCAEGEIKLSDLTDGRLPKSGIDHVFVQYPHGHFTPALSMDIPDINEEYYWDPNVLEAIICGYKLNERILLQGYPGTGKTTAIHQFAAWIQQPYLKMGGKDGVDPSSFLGMPWAEGAEDGMTFKLGMLPQGLIAGYMICIDEIFKLPAGIMMAMQSLLEKDGVLILDDMPGTVAEKTIIPHTATRIFTTDNVLGTGDDISKFAATQLQDTSTLDRIGLTIKVNYLEKAQELSMLSKRYPKIDKRDINNLITLAKLVRKGYASDEVALTLSPRGLMVMLSLHEEVNLPLTQAINLSFTNKIADKSERAAVAGFISAAGIR